jgi:hypothetical protein
MTIPILNTSLPVNKIMSHVTNGGILQLNKLSLGFILVLDMLSRRLTYVYSIKLCSV